MQTIGPNLMRFLFILFSLFVFTPNHVHAWENYSPVSKTVYVQKIEPGSILIVNDYNVSNKDNFPIRFYGIGIPTKKQPCGNEAAALLRELLPQGTKIIISTVRKDEEGIISALVQLKDHSVNSRFVDEGLAWVDRSTCKAFFCRRWHIQESLAIKDRRGIWATNIPTPPWQWGEPKEGQTSQTRSME